MRSLGGLVLLTGIGVGLFVYWPAPVDRDTSLEHVRRAAAERAAEQTTVKAKTVVAGARTFSPGVSLASVGAGHRNSKTAVRPKKVRHVQGAPLSGWQTALASTGASLKTQARALEPMDARSRYELTVALQRQLKDKGCYLGRIDGSWGRGSKRAMSTFATRVNSAVPVEDPTGVLLTLIKSNEAASCRGCPADHTLSPGGRCIPQTTVVQTAPQQPAVMQQATVTTSETLPWQTAATEPADAQPLFKPLPSSVISTSPLPGRMAVGGPATLPPVNSVYAPQPTTTGPGQGYAPGAVAELPPSQDYDVKPKKKAKKYKSSRRLRRGTPRYNLMMSLGGVY
jgi:hypothetical protein